MYKIGILVETHVNHRRFLKTCLESIQKIENKGIVVSYNLNEPLKDLPSYGYYFPAPDILSLADRWIFQSCGMLCGSWSNLVHSGVNLLNIYDIDYIFLIEGDCIIRKPEGIYSLIAKMEQGGYDMVPCGTYGDTQCENTSFIAKKDVILKIMDKLISDWRNGRDISGSEGRFGQAIYDCKIKKMPVRNPESRHFAFGDRGTWGDELGFLHLHGIEKWRRFHHHKPLPLEFYDLRFNNDRKILEEYWKTKDLNVFFKYNYWEKRAVDDEEYIALHGEEDI